MVSFALLGVLLHGDKDEWCTWSGCGNRGCDDGSPAAMGCTHGAAALTLRCAWLL
jgi:hypothetical protein